MQAQPRRTAPGWESADGLWPVGREEFGGELGRLRVVLPKIAPMKAVTGELPPPGDAWAAEVKWDGQRLVAAVGDPDQLLRLDTTRGLDAAVRFPELDGLPAALAPHRLILDGEIVAFSDGRANFGLLQHRMHLTRTAEITRVAARIPARYMVFDLLWLDDHDLTSLTYLERREMLTELVEPAESGRLGRARG